MRVVLAAFIIAVLTGTAFAQQAVPKYGEDLDKSKSPTEIRAEKDAARAYERSLGNIPDKGPGDPWGAVRANDGPKAASATAKPKKTKTGSAEAKQ